jgi:prepilin-type N-terminal cleavage/methylation domain-containing protein
MKAVSLKKSLKGFSIIELLIAIIIIGILVAVIVPRLATRSELARQRAAKSDLEHIRNAEEHAGIDTGYYYRLYVLDDNPGGDGIGTGQTGDINDGLRDEIFNQITPNPIQIFIDLTKGELLDPLSASIIFQKAIDPQAETAFNWQGRYITWQKDYYGFQRDLQGNLIPNDLPDDPWGHDYLFFTEKGLMLEPYGLIVPSCSIDANGNFIAGSSYDCLRFDRFTLLSLGANGLPGAGAAPNDIFGKGDDLIEQW